MEFDPENVEEFCADRYVNETAQCVYRRDYMKLLELYRNLLRDWNQGLSDSHHAARSGLSLLGGK